MIKKNDILRLEISDITNLGFGVARHEGAVIFVSGAVRGDVVLAKIIKTGGSYYVARCEEIISKSKIRCEGRCHEAECRSCAYRDILYAEELKIKREAVLAIFKKSGLSSLRVSEVYPSPLTEGYRNKAQYPLCRDKQGNIKIGFFAPKSHNVREAAGCALAPSVFRDILELLRGLFEELNITVYDEASGEGLLRHIYLRRGETTGEILLTLVINGGTLPGLDKIIARVKEEFPSVVGILINENKMNTNVILGDSWHTVFGRDYIYDTLGGVKLKITAPSFYQVNRQVADAIYAEAKRLASPTKSDTLLDLFCGAGSIGLSMARDAGRLIGIEIVAAAVECAKFNAELNGIQNADFFTGDAENTEALLQNAEISLGEKINPTLITLDPPRSGCDAGLIDFICSKDPRAIVYISCNPATLARDILRFSDHGYRTETVKLYDMFPGTGHVECVVRLCRSSHSSI